MGEPTVETEASLACPSCGRAVDPLRAGHVAILNGGFRYFCDEACKRTYVGRSAAPLPSQVETAEPPRVAPVSFAIEATPAPPPSEPSPLPPPTAAPAVAPSDPSPSPSPSPPPVVSAPSPSPVALAIAPPRGAFPAIATPEPARTPTPTPPSGAPALSSPGPLRPSTSDLPLARDASDRRTPARGYLLHALHGVGVASGVLAASLGLLGPAAQPARLVLATLAVAGCFARAIVVPRDPSDVHPLAALSPVAAIWAVALYAGSLGDARALGLASVAGLAAAVQLASAFLVDRAREGVRTARAWIHERLEVTARVVREGGTTVGPAQQVRAGEEIRAVAGDTLGVDVRILEGTALVTPWLDASVEVEKKAGDAVVAGARVVSGDFRAVVTWGGADRAWLKLSSSPALRPDVVGPLARGVRVSIERGTVVAALLVAGLGVANGASGLDLLAIAAVAAFAVAGSGAASIVALHQARGPLSALAHGVVYRDAAAFDTAGRTDVAVLCSRGTVLMGAPEIVALEVLAPLEPGRLLSLAAAASTAVAHPVNQALSAAAPAKGEPLESVRHATYHPGLGVTALTGKGDALVVGNRALLLREKVSIALADGRASELEAEGKSVTLIALGGKLVGFIALQDALRPGARGAVQRLLDARIEPVLLSGEARETCETIGRALDVEHIRPEVLPADLGSEVRALGEGGHVVAVLGHPNEDDGALSASPVSVALASAGLASAEWGISLASDDVRDAARALFIAKETRDRTKAAIALGLVPGWVAAIGIGLGLLPLSMGPLLALAGLMAAVVHAKR